MEKDIKNDMNDVIATSRKMREYLLNDEIPFEDRVKVLPLYKITLDANKNIVSASSLKIALEKLKE